MDIQTPQIIARGRHLEFVRLGHWEYVQRRSISGIVGIAAVTDAGELVLIEQFRPPVGKPVIEIPAGLAGDIQGAEDEPLLEAAQRELLEETGYTAGRWDLLFSGVSSAGLCNEVIHCYRARQLQRRHAGGGDSSEQITVHHVPIEQVHDWSSQQVQAGKQVDLKIFSVLPFVG